MNQSNINSTRSEAVRQRRKQETNKKTYQSTAKVYYRTTTNNPVITRNRGNQGIPTRRQKADVKRRMNIALNVPGAEVRMPALPILNIGWRWVSGLLIAAMAWALFTLWNSSSFIVYEPEIIGNNRTPAIEINRAIGMTGRSIVEARPEEITGNIQAAFPEFSSVHVEIGLPASVNVIVTERSPVITWEMNGQSKWIDSQGIAFPARGEVAGLIHVMANGEPPLSKPDVVEINASTITQPKASAEQYLMPELVKALKVLAPYVPPGTALVYDPEYGLGWNDSRGWQVYFGEQTGNMTLKLAIYQAIVDHLSQKGVSPVMISVEYPEAPFYRLEQ